MAHPRGEEPEKFCEFCGTRFNRSIFNGRLEDLGVFRRRKYCTIRCASTRDRQSDNGEAPMSSISSAQFRTCKNCRQLKPIEAFRYRADRRRYNVVCRPCENHRGKQGIVRPRHVVDKPRKLVDEKPIGEDYKYEMYKQDVAFQAAMMAAIASK